jgi:hypothetical protein
VLKSQLFWRISKWSFVALALIVVLFVITLIAVPKSTESREACYWMSGMLPMIECPTVPNRRVVEFMLNFPFVALFLPVFPLAPFAKMNVWIVVLAIVDGAVIITGLLYPFRLVYLKWFAKNHGG